MTTRVAIYARVSTVNHGQDVSMQTRELRQFAEARGWPVAREYIDAGVSGAKDSRPELNRLMADAHSASRTEPAFIAKPAGAPVYYGFQVLEDVVVEGFTFGKITDFEAEPCQEGDAFLVAPDNSRAGLVWEVADKISASQISPLEPDRWGVWAVSFPYQMNSRENVRRNLELILPILKEKWNDWRGKFPGI
jgi:hypothetical protein